MRQQIEPWSLAPLSELPPGGNVSVCTYAPGENNTLLAKVVQQIKPDGLES